MKISKKPRMHAQIVSNLTRYKDILNTSIQQIDENGVVHWTECTEWNYIVKKMIKLLILL